MSHDRERRRMLLAGVGAVGALAMARSARAATCGDPGPLSPTGPTMRQIFEKVAETDVGTAEARIPIQSLPSSATALYRISQPGVYYLTDNILGVAGSAGVEVDSSDVEIECDGFCFIGVPGTRQGIVSTGAHHAIGVYDVEFVGWQETCIDLSSSTDCYAEEVWCRSCNCVSPLGLGAIALGDGGTIDDCNVFQCNAAHLRTGVNGIVEECVIRECVSSSILSVGPAVVEDNFLTGNSGGSGISVDTGAVILSNRLVSSSGIQAGGDSVVQENDLSACPGGIVVNGSSCTVEENHVSSGGSGISVVSPATSVMVEGNNVIGCTGTGISVTATGCIIVRNSVSSPTGTAYSIGGGNSYGSIVSAVAVGDLGSLGIALDTWINFEF
jgi:hypothetical protein